MMCVPSAASGRDRRVMTEAAISAGARQAWLIETPVAAALGLGLPVAEAGPQGVCDLGAGSVQAAVIARSGVVAVAAEPGGGHALDEKIAQMVLERHGVRLDESAAEALKVALGSALPQDASLTAEASGVDAIGGGAAAPSVTAAELTLAMTPWLRSAASLVRGVVEQTPAELAFEVVRRGFHLTGGGALLRGIDRYLEEETGIPCRVGNDPLTCAVLGTKRALGEFEVVQRRQLYLR
jgi:rod shape-determining protein MreB